jgi:hypothetical protein
MVRNCNNVSICIWYEMVIMYRSAYGYTQVHAACWYRKKHLFKTKKKTNEKKNIHVYIHIINFIKCSVISTLFIILFNKDNYFVTTCRTFEVIKLFLH